MDTYKYIYGPVPSRRMGFSIGISPIPKGHCNYSCIYCQLGRARKRTNTRREYFKDNDVIKEFQEYLKGNIDLDVVTIIGEGEPLLYANIGLLIEKLKEISDKLIAIITNVALLSQLNVGKELKKADIVFPSLDAIDQDMFKKITIAYRDISYDDVLNGLIEFSKSFKGQLWIETMLIKGINDNKEFFIRFKEVLSKIDYHSLYINSPIRPPAIKTVECPTEERISIDKLVPEGFYSGIKDDYESIISIIRGIL